MRAGHLTLPIVALLALAACDNGGSDVQQVPEPPSSSDSGVAAGSGAGDEADDPGMSGSPDAEGDTNDSGAANGDAGEE